MVGNLEHHQGATETYIHVIGHSLGAHVAGFAGKTHKKTRYQRITGIISKLAINYYNIQLFYSYSLNFSGSNFISYYDYTQRYL